MVLDSKIQQVKLHFGIQRLSDWEKVRPEWILQLHGVGQATLDHIRMYLAARDMTLCEDGTAVAWRTHFSDAKICHTMGMRDIGVTCPFTVLIDSQEKQPFTFRGLSCDKDQRYRPLIVPIVWRSLGPTLGDYSIDGYEGRCHVERKSMVDAHGTILGWGEHRDRFERELRQLSEIDCAAVVVECTIGQLVSEAPSHGKKSNAENGKILFRQVLAWQQDYRVPWVFCDGRRLAEIATFRILERFWKKNHDRTRTTKKDVETESEQILLEL